MSMSVTLLFLALWVLSACAVDLGPRSSAAELKKQGPPTVIKLDSDLHLDLPSRLSARPLEAESQWERVGEIPQGEVYRSLDSVLMLNSGNRHEAYLVMSGGNITGLYLPFEERFVEGTAK